MVFITQLGHFYTLLYFDKTCPPDDNDIEVILGNVSHHGSVGGTHAGAGQTPNDHDECTNVCEVESDDDNNDQVPVDQ